jgi:NinB protein
MIYDGNNPLHQKQAIEKLKLFIKKGKRFELKTKQPRRSIAQNSYLHLILSWFAVETGYTIEEVKQEIFKKHVNSSLFYEGEYEGKIEGFKIERWRSSASLDSKEMTLAIDRFRNFSSIELGIYLPEPTDLIGLQELENELSKHDNLKFV